MNQIPKNKSTKTKLQMYNEYKNSKGKKISLVPLNFKIKQIGSSRKNWSNLIFVNLKNEQLMTINNYINVFHQRFRPPTLQKAMYDSWRETPRA